jgi:membrane protein DedA with SNARE-associated domain
MLFAGFNVSDGQYPLWAPVLVASVANLVGSWVAWAAGYYGRVEVLERNRFVHLSPAHLAWADRWFQRYGDVTVFFARMLPIVRTFISLPAGVARMPFWRFSILTFLGALPWNFALVFIGREARDNWESWRSKLHYIDYAVIVIIIAAAVYFAVRWWRTRRGRTAADAA